MPRSLSRSQIDKLGERLAKYSPAREEDLRLLGSFRAEYLAPLQAVQKVLAGALSLEPHPRLKTNTTIIEKLRRARTRLSTMQDIGGLRIVVDGSLKDQDLLVSKILGLLGGDVEDRRTRPSAGYRAVHVIVEHDGFPIEIQVRTRLQHGWAEAFESLGDRLGRGIRYGQPVDRPDEKFGRLTAQEVVQTMQLWSRIVADLESIPTHNSPWGTFAMMASGTLMMLFAGDSLRAEFEHLAKAMEPGSRRNK